MSKDSETVAKLKVLLRDWEQAKVNGIPGLEADITLMRERIRELEHHLRFEVPKPRRYARELGGVRSERA